MTIVVPSSSAEVMANPARFLEEIRAGHFVYLADLGGTVALTEADDEVEDMVSLRSAKTGIDTTIFISTKGYARHAPGIKIAVDPPHTFNATAKAASMAIHDYSMTGAYLAPHVVEQAMQFIDRNRAAQRRNRCLRMASHDEVESVIVMGLREARIDRDGADVVALCLFPVPIAPEKNVAERIVRFCIGLVQAERLFGRRPRLR